MKNISILGSTGSIGTQTLDIVRNNPELSVSALCAGSNIKLLEAQAREFRPKLCVIYDREKYKELKEALKDTGIMVASGMEGLIEAAVLKDVETVVAAIVGMIGIEPVIKAIEAGKDIALANKETLVTAGHIIMPLSKKKGIRILPVDSEHSAIFQCLNGEPRERIENILLTASGGPFRGRKKEELVNIKAEDALKHPNWSMGRKITIDSATMVNKGLEIMEAGWLFDVPVDKIRVIVHPQSIIHSAVEFSDGAVIAQLGTPDMRIPIQYALFYPDRKPLSTKKLNLTEISKLTFEEPDPDNFPGLALAMDAALKGGSLPTVFNAANERAVSLFLDGRIGFLDIALSIEHCMEKHNIIKDPSLKEILTIKEKAEADVDALWGII